jgi:hypothetical protein
MKVTPFGPRAILAAALAVAGFAGQAVAQDDCTEVQCRVEQAIQRSMDAAGADPEQLAELLEEIRDQEER